MGYDRLVEILLGLKAEVPSGATTEMSPEQRAQHDALIRHLRDRASQWDLPLPVDRGSLLGVGP